MAFRDNEFVAVLGQSGSGKTTMLNVIGGLSTASRAATFVTDGFDEGLQGPAHNNRIGFASRPTT